MFRLRDCATGWGSVLSVLVLVLGLGAPAALEAQVLSGGLSGDLYGHSVAWAGDVDNDGKDDFLVGVPHAVGSGGAAGEVELYLGRYGMFPTSPDLVLEGEVSGDEFGFAVSTAGDVNGDGYDDFLVGAPGHDSQGADAGRVYLYLGGSNPSSTPARSWDGDLPGARFGAAVAGGFDFNRDGRDDFAVGSPEITDTQGGGGVAAGQVKIFLGAGSAAQIQQPSAYVFYGTLPNSLLGFSLRDAGDVDGDDFGDLVAGAPETTSPFRSGYAVLWFGQSSTFSAPQSLVLSGEQGADRFGWDVAGAGDVNGDTYDDLWIGAPLNDDGGADAGSAYLYYGGSSPNASDDWQASGSVGGDRLGSAVDGGFDVNGDGTADLVAGAPRSDVLAGNAGEVRVYYGGSLASAGNLTIQPMSPVPSFEANDEFGSSVRLIGSYNGDATDDDARAEILAGAPEGNTTQSGEAGYVNFIVDPGSYVPVRVLAFEAASRPGGVLISWELAGFDALSGVRVEAVRDAVPVPLHEGWLAPASGSLTDHSATGTSTTYRLLGRERAGAVTQLASVIFDGGRPVLAFTPPDRNPFRGSVRFAASLPAGPASVVVWDVRGRKVRTLFEGTSAGGSLDLGWDGRDDQGAETPAGLYLVLARTPGARAAFKLVRLP